MFKQASVLPVAIFSLVLNPNLGENYLLFSRVTFQNTPVVAEYIPPDNIGAPPSTGGGTRGGKCPQDEEANPNTIGISLTAIMPDRTLANGFGLTVSESPQFFVFLPPTAAESGEFVLKDENENDIYRTDFALNGKAGIISLRLPKNYSVKLEIGKNYHWYLAIICNARNRRQDISIDGWTRRVEIPANLMSQLNSASARDRSNLYAKNGIWHEAVATLAAERSKAPNDTQLVGEWKRLLVSAKIEKIGDVPFSLTELEGN